MSRVMSRVLVATDAGVVALADDGTRRTEREGRVTALAATGNEWWAIADRRTVIRRSPDGVWEDVATHTGDRGLTAIEPDPEATHGGAYVGTADGHLLHLRGREFAPVSSFDRIDGRDSWHAVGTREPYTRSITATTGGVLLASVHVGGIPRSTDRGASWAPTIDVDDDVHEVRAHPVDPQLVLAVAAVGLLESHDGGATWTTQAEGLHATYAQAVAFPVGAVLISASNGPRGDQSALYRRSLEAGPLRSSPLEPTALERCRRGLPEWLAGNINTGCLHADGALVALGDSDGTLFLSDDGGRSWRVLAHTLGYITSVGVAA